MRISGGLLKGKRIRTLKISPKRGAKEGYRPTSSKVREALFDILRNDIEDASFLDLYAGSGTVGFEALSRGAGRCCFVERDTRRYSEIVSAVKRMGLSDRALAFREDASEFLRKAAGANMAFGIIFADPPYASEEAGRILQILDAGGILEAGGVLMIEHSSKQVLGDDGRSLRLVRNYRYGDTVLTLFRRDR